MKFSRITLASLLLAGTLGLGVHAQTAPSASASPATSAQQQSFSTTLAKAELTKQGITLSNTSPADYKMALERAIQHIEAQRSAGLGWGAIANSMGLNWGKVRSAEIHERNAAREAQARLDESSDHSKAGDSHGGGKGNSGNSGGAGGSGGGKK